MWVWCGWLAVQVCGLVVMAGGLVVLVCGLWKAVVLWVQGLGPARLAGSPP